MASMVIRNIPADVFDRFKARAKAQNKSAEQMAREAIAEAAGKSQDDVWAEMDAIRARSRPVPLEEVLRIMQEARDERDGRDERYGLAP